MRSTTVALIAVLAALMLPSQASSKFRYTHRVDISAELTDTWSVTDPASCGSNGDGSLKVTLTSNGVTRIRPFISKFGGRPRSRKAGVWVLGVPGGGGVTHMRSRKATGTITTADNTVTGPNTEYPGEPCYQPDKSDCKTKALKRALVGASGWDLKNLYADFYAGGGSFRNLTSCRVGVLGSWTYPYNVAGGINRYSDLLLKMPSARALKTKPVVTITATDHKTSTGKPSENSTESITDNVTRTMTVTFTKL